MHLHPSAALRARRDSYSSHARLLGRAPCLSYRSDSGGFPIGVSGLFPRGLRPSRSGFPGAAFTIAAKAKLVVSVAAIPCESKSGCATWRFTMIDLLRNRYREYRGTPRIPTPKSLSQPEAAELYTQRRTWSGGGGGGSGGSGAPIQNDTETESP